MIKTGDIYLLVTVLRRAEGLPAHGSEHNLVL